MQKHFLRTLEFSRFRAWGLGALCKCVIDFAFAQPGFQACTPERLIPLEFRTSSHQMTHSSPPRHEPCGLRVCGYCGSRLRFEARYHNDHPQNLSQRHLEITSFSKPYLSYSPRYCARCETPQIQHSTCMFAVFMIFAMFTMRSMRFGAWLH